MNVSSTSRSGQQNFSCLLLTLSGIFFLPIRFMLLTKLFRQMSDDGDDTMTMTTTTSVCTTKRSSSAQCTAEHVLHSCQNLFMERILWHLCCGNLIFIGFLCFFVTLSCVWFSSYFCVPLAFSLSFRLLWSSNAICLLMTK